MYESSVAIHYWEQGSVFQNSDKISRYLTSVWARGHSMPIENCEARFEYRGSRIKNREISRFENWEPRVENRGSGIEDRGSRIENREAGSEDRGSWIEDRELRTESRESRIGDRGSRIENRESRSGKRGSRIVDRGSRIENRESGIEKRGSRIENGACQAGSGKLMRMADRFRIKWKFQYLNISCYF